jgi:hypothetical protein
MMRSSPRDGGFEDVQGEAICFEAEDNREP